jgi:FkbM family methyltransferase
MKKLLQSALGKCGLQLVRSETVLSYSLSSYFALLKRLGFAPKHIIDVGANRGNWTKEAIRFFPDAHYTLVEPQDHLKRYVQDLIDDGRVSWIGAGAGDAPGTLPFSVSTRDDSSTFVHIRGQKSGNGPERMVPIRTLNEIVSSSIAPVPDMVKIDAEGFDLRVLAGASQLIGRTEVFLVEAVIRGPYENTLQQVLRWMEKHEYRVMDITDLNRSPESGVLWLLEIAFVRVDSPLLERAS